MYFKRFPVIYYPVVVNGKKQFSTIKDISINVRFIKEFLSNISLYDLYDVVDGETPEIISEKFYDTPLYHWIVMLANERYDYVNDFPLPFDKLYDSVIQKYGEEGVNSVHHYENQDGFIVNSDASFASPITNLQYEESLNENKRTIKIIDKTIIERVVNDFVKSLK